MFSMDARTNFSPHGRRGCCSKGYNRVFRNEIIEDVNFQDAYYHVWISNERAWWRSLEVQLLVESKNASS